MVQSLQGIEARLIHKHTEGLTQGGHIGEKPAPLAMQTGPVPVVFKSTKS